MIGNDTDDVFANLENVTDIVVEELGEKKMRSIDTTTYQIVKEIIKLI